MIRAARIREAAQRLLEGGVAVIPTDTVYGLAAHPGRPEAVARLYTLKERPRDKPIPLLIADETALEALGARLDETARRLAQRWWPGPLTLVIDTPGGTEGVRVPDCALTRELLRQCGGALRATSANRSGKPPALTAAAALAALGPAAKTLLVLDDGPAPRGRPSTVVRVTEGTIEVLRPGAVPETDLRKAACKPD